MKKIIYGPIIYSNRNDNFDTKHKYNILFSGGVHSSRPWDKEWTAGEVVTCTGILPMLTLYQYGYAKNNGHI